MLGAAGVVIGALAKAGWEKISRRAKKAEKNKGGDRTAIQSGQGAASAGATKFQGPTSFGPSPEHIERFLQPLTGQIAAKDAQVAAKAARIAELTDKLGLAVRDSLAKSDPGNARLQRDLMVSFNRIGDVLIRQDNLPEAMKSFRDGLTIAAGLAKSDAGNALWQRDIFVSYIHA